MDKLERIKELWLKVEKLQEEQGKIESELDELIRGEEKQQEVKNEEKRFKQT